ncbi:MAG TPA: hypothetical protein VEH82_01175, partial [Acidimicrobiales bacterium]|nr:hypothetical protein [Acidimicrobiales bacterium]
MSGPHDAGRAGGADDAELPWPRPEPPTDALADDRPEDLAGADADASADTSEGDASAGGAAVPPARRAARAARVRRRRRWLAGIAGALLVVVLAFVLWYEVESHALGPEGPQVV